MSHPFDEPLTPEERAMADRLARLGPRDGPSPALDAKILAAAHAAVAPRRGRRWLALSGVPATLVTGAGMAAVLALAVGVVWQLRPSAPAPRAPRDEAGDFGFVTAEVIERPEPAAAPPPPPAADVPAPARALQAPAMARREAAPKRADAMATKEAPAATAAPAPGQAPEHFLDEAIEPATHSVPATATAATRGDSMPYSSAPAAPAAAAAAIEGEQRQRAAASAMQRKATANEADKQVAADRELRSQAASVVAADRAEAASADAMAAEDTASGATLDRIEVTGSRITMADTPVRNDRELAPAQWLQRIRDRRDGGDLDGARQSLEQFRKSYPRVRLPDDLRALADPTR
jgi:hypothetical protein